MICFQKVKYVYIYIYNGNITKSSTHIRNMDIRGIFDHFLYDFWLVSLDIKDFFLFLQHKLLKIKGRVAGNFPKLVRSHILWLKKH